MAAFARLGVHYDSRVCLLLAFIHADINYRQADEYSSHPSADSQTVFNEALMLLVTWCLLLCEHAMQSGADQDGHGETDNTDAHSLFSLEVMLRIYTCHSNDAIKTSDGRGLQRWICLWLMCIECLCY